MKIAIYIDAEDLAIGIKEVLKINKIQADVIYNTLSVDLNSYDIVIVSDDRLDRLSGLPDNKIILISNNENRQFVNYILRPFTAKELMAEISKLIP